MKAKTIAKVLNKVHENLLSSITDERVRRLVKKNSIITGGSIVSMLMGDKVNDYDYYFTNKETVEAVANYYVNKFNELNPHKSIKPQVVVEDDRVRVRIQSAGFTAEGESSNSYQYFEACPDPTQAETYIEENMGVLNNKDNGNKFRPIFISDNAITLS